MLLKRLGPSLLYAALAALVVFAAAVLQEREILQIGFVGAVLAGWLLSMIIFGYSMRNSILFASLLFIKPIPTAFICMMGILFVSLLIEWQKDKLQSFKIPYPIALSVLVAVSVYGLIRGNGSWYTHLYFQATALVPALLLLIVSNSRFSKDDYLVWVKALALIGTFLAVIGVIMALLNPTERYGSLWITAMTINGFYIITFFFAIALGIRAGRNANGWFWFVCALLILMGMLYTYTRIVLVSVFAGILLLMLKMKRMRLLGMGILLLVPLAIPSSMVSRIEMGMGFDYSIFIRFVAWYYSLKQIYLHPWFGIGIDVWKEWYVGAVPMDILYAEHSHNLLLKIWLELGVFGFLSYFYLIGAILRRYWLNVVKREEGNFHFAIFVGVIAVLIACLTDIFIQQYPVAFAFWILLAFMYLHSRQFIPMEQK
jgi:hypothetical protein